jgi:hypothetical protein
MKKAATLLFNQPIDQPASKIHAIALWVVIPVMLTVFICLIV